ncbi:MAG: 16S rRNA (guanine(527)-N(7))-methyltransferase RsmG [Acidobacteriia bacterium]|nr:16S rRNA (guanine(527)-N(7))-methyltransferase RsmG [Terriglobia bacterium]
MKPDRIAELLAPFLEPQSQRPNTQDLVSHISIYIDILQRWNARINLTAIRDEEEIVTRHFGESLFAARNLFPLCPSVPPVVKGFAVADVGSGAGFPGIPIKLWAPEISLTLIESNQKKATFLKEVTRALTLTNINIQTTRAESLSAASFDVVTLRAVERFESILPVAARLVVPGGRLALLIGQAQLEQAQSRLPALNWCQPIPVPTSQSCVFVTASKPN